MICLNTPSKVRFLLNLHPKLLLQNHPRLNVLLLVTTVSAYKSWSKISQTYCQVFNITCPPKDFPSGTLIHTSEHTSAIQCFKFFNKTWFSKNLFITSRSSHSPLQQLIRPYMKWVYRRHKVASQTITSSSTVKFLKFRFYLSFR